MQNVLVAPSQSIARSLASTRISIGVIRWPERVIIGFLIYAAAMASVMPVAPNVTRLVVLLNLAVILTYVLLFQLDSGKRMLAAGVIRDWLPLGLLLIAYREMGWLALPPHGYTIEAHWVIWDRLALRGGARAAIEAFGPVLPSVLEIAYSLVYALAPFSLAVLYLYRRRERVDTFLFIFALGVLLCYAQFPFWPSEPPRVVFSGEDLPTYGTIFRRFNLWMLGNYGIHTSVFPSAHVAGAFSAAFGMRQALPEHKWVSRFLYGMALLIAVATVYGRYHYCADAAAGLLMAVLVLALHRYLTRVRPAQIVQTGVPSFRTALLPRVMLLAFVLVSYTKAAEAPHAASIAQATAQSVNNQAAIAFARYTAGLEQARPWGLETIEIEAALPKLEKLGRLRAIRSLLPHGKPEYRVLEIEGDQTVTKQVIARYLSAEIQAAELPARSVAITPANYKFRYKCAMQKGAGIIYAFLIAPHKNREGLIRGELWIDGATGAVVRQSGYLVKRPSIFVKRVDVIQEMTIRDGSAEEKVTYLSVDTRLIGRAELTIHERPYAESGDGSAPGVTEPILQSVGTAPKDWHLTPFRRHSRLLQPSMVDKCLHFFVDLRANGLASDLLL